MKRSAAKEGLAAFFEKKEQQELRDGINAFKRQWLRCFAKNVPQAQLARYVDGYGHGDCLWHVFSWELLPKSAYLTGDAARKAYDGAKKTNVLIWEPYEGTGVSAHCPEEYRTSAGPDGRTEIVIMEKNGAWTYIKTHEPDCGPFFFRPPPTD